MSDAGGGGEKREKPTPKKLRDARQKGQVPRNKELVSAFSTGAILLMFWMSMGDYMHSMVAIFDVAIQSSTDSFQTIYDDVSSKIISESGKIVFPFLAVVLVVTILGSIAQGGFIFAFEVIKPKPENFNPSKYFKNTFSMKNVMEMVKSLIKAIALSVIIYFLIFDHIQDLLHLPECGKECVAVLWGDLALRIFAYSTAIYFVVAVFDTFFQNHQHMKSLMMSMQEVKKEFKETEGDPFVKGARQELAYEIVNSDTNSKLAASSTLITNPTHYAVGIRYVEGETKLPIVTLKARGDIVIALRKRAQEQDIPVLQNRKLARALHAKAKELRPIPSEYIVQIAEVVKWLKSLPGYEKRKPKDLV